MGPCENGAATQAVYSMGDSFLLWNSNRAGLLITKKKKKQTQVAFYSYIIHTHIKT